MGAGEGVHLGTVRDMGVEVGNVALSERVLAIRALPLRVLVLPPQHRDPRQFFVIALDVLHVRHAVVVLLLVEFPKVD